MNANLSAAISAFGATAREKLVNIAATGEPEDQLRAPFEALLADMTELANIPRAKVTAVGESSLSELKTRPDYAITVHHALVGFVELKAPGKGADPPPRNSKRLAHIRGRLEPHSRLDGLPRRNDVFFNHCGRILHHEFHLRSSRSDALAGSLQFLPTRAEPSFLSNGSEVQAL